MSAGDEITKVAAQQPEGLGVTAAKVGTAWAAVGITSWADAASALAFLYTLLLLCEWVWKKLVRPFAERRGWLRRPLRRKEDVSQS